MSFDRKLGRRLSSMFRRDAASIIPSSEESRAFDVIIPAPRFTPASSSSTIQPSVEHRPKLNRPAAGRRAPSPIDTSPNFHNAPLEASLSRRQENLPSSTRPPSRSQSAMNASPSSKNVLGLALPVEEHGGPYLESMVSDHAHADTINQQASQWDHSQNPNWLGVAPVASAIDSLVDDIEGYFLDTKSGQRSGLSTQPQTPTLPYRLLTNFNQGSNGTSSLGDTGSYPWSYHTSYLRKNSNSFLDPYDPSSPHARMNSYRDIYPSSPVQDAHREVEHVADDIRASHGQMTADSTESVPPSPVQKERPYFEPLLPSPMQKSRPFFESLPPSPVQDTRPYPEQRRPPLGPIAGQYAELSHSISAQNTFTGDTHSYPELHNLSSTQEPQAASPTRSYISSRETQQLQQLRVLHSEQHVHQLTDLVDSDSSPDHPRSNSVSGAHSIKSASFSDSTSRRYLASSGSRLDSCDMLTLRVKEAPESYTHDITQPQRSAHDSSHEILFVDGNHVGALTGEFSERLMPLFQMDTAPGSLPQTIIPTSERSRDFDAADYFDVQVPDQAPNASASHRASQGSNFSAGTYYNNSRHVDPILPQVSPSTARTPEPPSPVYKDLWGNDPGMDRTPRSLKAVRTPNRSNYELNQRVPSQASAPRYLLRHTRQLSSMSLIYSTGSFRNVSLGSLKRNISLKPGEGERSHYVTAVRRAAGTANNDTGPGKWRLPTGIMPIDRASTYSNDRFIRLAGAQLLSSGRGKKTSGVELKHGHLAPRLLAAEVDEGGGSLIGKKIAQQPPQPVTPKPNDMPKPETPRLAAPSFSPVQEEEVEKRQRLESISSTQSASVDITGYYQHPLYRVESDKSIEEQVHAQARPLKLANPDGSA